MYDDEYAFAATSRKLENRNKEDVDVKDVRLKMIFQPGKTPDTVMHADIEMRVRKDGLKHLAFGITALMEAKKLVVDGEEVEFLQPSIPGREWLHAPFITVPLARPR